MGHHQQVHDNREKQVQGCMVDVIIPINLVCVHFDPPIHISSIFSCLLHVLCKEYN